MNPSNIIYRFVTEHYRHNYFLIYVEMMKSDLKMFGFISENYLNLTIYE